MFIFPNYLRLRNSIRNFVKYFLVSVINRFPCVKLVQWHDMKIVVCRMCDYCLWTAVLFNALWSLCQDEMYVNAIDKC